MNTIEKRLGAGVLRLMISGGVSILKTIMLGLEESPEDYLKALEEADVSIGERFICVVNNVSVSSEPVELDLIAVSVADLGSKNGTKRSKICEAGIALGFELCPAEAALALRLGYEEQPCGESLHMAMESLVDSTGAKYVFEVDRTVFPWIDAGDGNPNRYYEPDDRFVFVKPRK